ncbi:MAG: autotransporter domain-containing protein [Rhizobiaceae bacterium]|nr:autotransporter domain-containing protein [Rhizobiaceae bacterium]
MASVAVLVLASSVPFGALAADGAGGVGGSTDSTPGGEASASGVGGTPTIVITETGSGGGSGVSGGDGGRGTLLLGGYGGATPGADGQSGVGGAGTTASGGGGGAHAYVGDGTNISGTILIGGDGGDGGMGFDAPGVKGGGGGGGGGGFGVVILDPENLDISISANLFGGSGGAGGDNETGIDDGRGGNGGNGGTGLLVASPNGANRIRAGRYVYGGSGGDGGDGPTTEGGDGGDGGTAVRILDGAAGSSLELNLASDVTGGAGGDASISPGSSDGGNGGAGVHFDGSNTALTLNVTGVVTGGDGGSASMGGTSGRGGVGIDVDHATINIAGTSVVSGGLNGGSTSDRANAIEGEGIDLTIGLGTFINGDILFKGADNRLTLLGDGDNHSGVYGSVTSDDPANDWVLNLAGAGGNFEMNDLGSAFQDVGKVEFAAEEATWRLSGTNVSDAQLEFKSGMVSVSNAASLGVGALTFSGGGLAGVGSLTLSNDIALNEDALFDTETGLLTLGGLISGEGALVKSGSGGLRLSGGNSYSGGTTIGEGSLAISDATAIGAGGLTINGGSSLLAEGSFEMSAPITLTESEGGRYGYIAVSRDETLTISGVISGDGALGKDGTGTLILTGNNTYQGGTTIYYGGVLQIGDGGTSGSITGDVQNDGTLIFNRSGNYTVDINLTGTGDLQLVGGGSATFSTDFAGTVEVDDTVVTLENGSTTGASFILDNGGTLGGSGTIGGLFVNDAGIAAPGYSPGTITVTGAVTFNSGSTYRVDVTPGGAHDLISATGIVTISSGAAVDLVAQPGAYAPSSTYAIITTAGTVMGTFGSVTSNYAFLTPTLTYDAQNVYLNLAYSGTSYSAYAMTPNQTSTSVAVQGLGAGNAVYDAILTQTTDAVAASYDSLSGEVYASVNSVLQQQSNYVREAVGGRMRQSGGTGDALEEASKASGATVAKAVFNKDLTLWAQAYGGWGDIGGNGNAGRVSNDTAGALVGADVQIAPGFRAGVFGGYGHSGLDVASRGSSGSVESYDVGAYASAEVASLALRSGVAYSWHDISADRSVAFPGFADTTSADYDTYTAQAFGEVAYGLSVKGYDFEPFAGLSYIHVDKAAFAESGGAAALSGEAAGMDTYYTTLGLRAATTLDLNGKVFTPSLSVGWQHALGDRDSDVSLAFAGSGSDFEVAGVPVGKDAFLVGAGLSFEVSDKAKLSVNYNGQYGSSQTQSAFSAQFAVKF